VDHEPSFSPGRFFSSTLGAEKTMRPFSTLTERGQALRLRHMALAALSHYDLPLKKICLVANHLNGIFRVDTEEGKTYALRISDPIWRTDDDLQTELLWLQALARETTIGVPKLFLNIEGNLITRVTCEGVPEARRAILMSWVRGRLLAEHLSLPNFTKFGGLAAQLHEHAATWRVPPDLKVPIRNGLYVRGEQDELHERNRMLFPDKSYAIFEHVRDQVQQAFARLYREGQGVRIIHADLHQENIKVFHGTLHPFDFEDVILGYPVQDIAQTFYDLLFFSELSNREYQLLREAFIQGYTSYLPWPETYPGQIDTFMAGQQLWRTNFVIRFERPYASSFIASLAQRFETFLKTGTMLK
jgi:Ser/Thr protein kinase RdoA (MazF antagonist)